MIKSALPQTDCVRGRTAFMKKESCYIFEEKDHCIFKAKICDIFIPHKFPARLLLQS